MRTGQRRQRAAGDQHLSGRGGGELENALQAAYDRLRVAGRVHRDLQRPQRPGQIEVPGQIDRRQARAGGVLRFPLVLVAQVDLGAVEESTGETEPGEPIGHHMVRTQVQRGTPAREALDERGVPGCPVRVEGNRFEPADEIEHLAQRSRPAHGGSAHVLLGVGRVVFDPGRARVTERRAAGPGPQPRRGLDHRVEPFDERVVARRVVEREQDAHCHAQRRVLSGLPHDRFDGAESFVHDAYRRLR